MLLPVSVLGCGLCGLLGLVPPGFALFRFALARFASSRFAFASACFFSFRFASVCFVLCLSSLSVVWRLRAVVALRGGSGEGGGALISIPRFWGEAWAQHPSA